VAGVVAGLTRAEVLERFDSIVAFAELEEVMENPFRTYSTGMQMRLAFAVAAHTDPEILLIDEVLAVGDLAFQRKCLQRIGQFKADGCAVVLVSHDMQLVRQLCDHVVWLGAGHVAAHGAADVVIRQYESAMDAETRRRTPQAGPPAHTPGGAELRVNENRFGSLELEIVAVRLLDAGGLVVSELDSGEPLRVAMEYVCREDIQAAIFGVSITREDDLICYETSTQAAGLTFSPPRGHGHMTLHIDQLDLARGNYFVNVGAYQRDWAYAFDHHWRAYPLAIRSAHGERGVVRLAHRCEAAVG
jgi:lipopolysaccharide transport system ATP-binding protein